MLLNYTIIALRNLRKNSTFSFINIFGLATGLAVALLITQYVRFELSYEHGNPLADRVVRLSMDYMNGGTVDAQDAETYPPIAARALREMNEVESYARAYPLRNRLSAMQIGDRYYQLSNVYAVDSSFFRMFNYPLVRGKAGGIFGRPREAVLTETMARTYFNTLDVVGKTIKVPRSNSSILVEIVGVVPDSPANTHLKFDMVLSYPTMLSDFGESEDNWNNNSAYTYLQLTNRTTQEAFTQSLEAFTARLLREKRFQNERVVAQKIGDIHLYSHKTFETEANGDPRSVYLLLGVAILVLLGAFVNYVNLTTARALDRAREVGVRKAVGSNQRQIRMQVLVETVLVNLLAGGLAVGIVAMLETSFIDITGLPESFTVLADAFFWKSAVAFLLCSVLLSGFYPAIVLASFEPVKVLKGNFSTSVKGAFLRKSLVVFQFAVTLILLVQTVVVYKQVKYMREQELGLNIDHTLVVKAPVGADIRPDYSAFRQMLLEQSQVKGVSFSGTVPGMGTAGMGTTTGVNLSGAAQKTYYNYHITAIDTSFIDQMSIRLLAGKNFDATTRLGFPDTTDRQLIVNMETLRLWEIKTPQEAIGKRVDLWGNQATIRAVVDNYHYDSPKVPHIPIIHLYSPRFDRYASVKFAPGNPAEQLTALKRVYEANFPYSPFTYFFLDSEYDKQYKTEDRFRQVFGFLTIIAVVISCLGLFGLATFTASKRTKEIGIRKVIGATTGDLVVLLSREYFKLIIVAIAIGLPVTYFLASAWLDNYATRASLTPYLFFGPALTMLLMVLVSIGMKTIATALLDPVKSLRSE
ncbi:ABC transporter permease [Dyadobacter chenwenxiniae]|uniref:ABC transporter permease n=1 Tax=Dyadobacter chenwenxiniae TaxID=2906456 RepID=A0A9X1TLX0_9BACT|nr:FtsX-like permease family protein [Dyadobacter chenwenxiniae]MCF0062818.1 ABC transporter permease [Dyadobacter chenwenxiniae]UON85007.1 ABC transporter permease [Dyadobacter chenwenxiniae]